MRRIFLPVILSTLYLWTLFTHERWAGPWSSAGDDQPLLALFVAFLILLPGGCIQYILFTKIFPKSSLQRIMQLTVAVVAGVLATTLAMTLLFGNERGDVGYLGYALRPLLAPETYLFWLVVVLAIIGIRMFVRKKKGEGCSGLNLSSPSTELADSGADVVQYIPSGRGARFKRQRVLMSDPEGKGKTSRTL